MLFLYINLIDSPEGKRKFEYLYNTYSQTMYYAANRILKNCHSAEDAVHQAFLSIMNHLDKIDENDYNKTRSFLAIISTHCAINIYHKQKSEILMSPGEIEQYFPHPIIAPEDCSDQILLAISQMPINYSTVLRLKFAQGYNNTEIAQLLNIKESNVRKRISRARKRLLEILDIETQG